MIIYYHGDIIILLHNYSNLHKCLLQVGLPHIHDDWFISLSWHDEILSWELTTWMEWVWDETLARLAIVVVSSCVVWACTRNPNSPILQKQIKWNLQNCSKTAKSEAENGTHQWQMHTVQRLALIRFLIPPLVSRLANYLAKQWTLSQ